MVILRGILSSLRGHVAIRLRTMFHRTNSIESSPHEETLQSRSLPASKQSKVVIMTIECAEGQVWDLSKDNIKKKRTPFERVAPQPASQRASSDNYERKMAFFKEIQNRCIIKSRRVNTAATLTSNWCRRSNWNWRQTTLLLLILTFNMMDTNKSKLLPCNRKYPWSSIGCPGPWGAIQLPMIILIMVTSSEHKTETKTNAGNSMVNVGVLEGIQTRPEWNMVLFPLKF